MAVRRTCKLNQLFLSALSHINSKGTSQCSGAVMLSSASHSFKSLSFAHIYCTALLIGWVKRISADGLLSWYFTCHWKRASCQLAREMLQSQLFAARVTSSVFWVTCSSRTRKRPDGVLKETFSPSQKHQDTEEILGYVRDDPRLDPSHTVNCRLLW